MEERQVNDATQRSVEHAGADELADLAAELEAAGDLPLDARLALLKRTEEAIARSLEGLDGL